MNRCAVGSSNSTATGLPLRVLLSAANTHDSKLFEPLLETNPAVRAPAPVTFLIKPGEGLQATGRGMTCCPCRP